MPTAKRPPKIIGHGGVCARLVLAAIMAAAWNAVCRAQDELPTADAIVKLVKRNTELVLTEREVRRLETARPLTDVAGHDPSIVKITVTDRNNQVRLIAQQPGHTVIDLTDNAGNHFYVDLFVKADVKEIEAWIQRIAPTSSVQVLRVKDSLILTGWVDQPTQVTEIVQLCEQHATKVLPFLRVSGTQTIVLHVEMMEVQRNMIRALGFNFLQLRQKSYVGSVVGGVAPFANQTPPSQLSNPFGGFLGPVASAVNPTAASAVFGLVSNDNAFQGFIEALKSEALLTLLAEPTLLAVNGRPANFLSGGQFPVPIPQGLGTVSVQYKNFGVQLDFVPVLLGNGRLRMQVSPEVSEKDFSSTVVVQGITVPSLTTRRVNTEVEMNFGQTLVIAGLLSNRVQARTQKIPFLGELPWVGAAFRRVSHDEAETELLVMVTPELAAPAERHLLPAGPGRHSASPTDRELYFNGYLEVPKYGPDPEIEAAPYELPAHYVPPQSLVAPGVVPVAPAGAATAPLAPPAAAHPDLDRAEQAQPEASPVGAGARPLDRRPGYEGFFGEEVPGNPPPAGAGGTSLEEDFTLFPGGSRQSLGRRQKRGAGSLQAVGTVSRESILQTSGVAPGSSGAKSGESRASGQKSGGKGKLTGVRKPERPGLIAP
jgi:pilus assembly protein CpaC